MAAHLINPSTTGVNELSNDLVEFIPHNMQEHDDMLRAIANKHMGAGQGNVSVWVIQALHEAYKRGFGLGYTTAQRGSPVASGAPPALHKALKAWPPKAPAGGMTRSGDVVDVEDITPRQLPRPTITLRREKKK